MTNKIGQTIGVIPVVKLGCELFPLLGLGRDGSDYVVSRVSECDKQSVRLASSSSILLGIFPRNEKEVSTGLLHT